MCMREKKNNKKTDTNLKVRAKLWNLTDLDFDLDPNLESTPNVETLYNLSCLPDTKKKNNLEFSTLCHVNPSS